MWGIDRLDTAEFQATRKRLRHGSSAVLTHDAALGIRGNRVLGALEALGAHPKLIFSPEHGLDGVAQAEEAVPHVEGDGARLPVFSLYGSTRESLTPSKEQLDGVDTLVIDLVDVGSRYYTYVWTALLAARAAAEAGVHTLVLDRPNPLGGQPSTVEGRTQEPGFLSFVGLEPVPVRHGATLGELLALCFERDGRQVGPEGALSVIGCSGWERSRDATAWGRPFVPPSPNMPTLETALLYPGGCLVEGTNLSEARGTAFPFRAVGAPFLDGESLAAAMTDAALPGLLVRPVAFRPSFEKHAGQVCRGVMLHVTDSARFRPVRTYLTLLALAQRQRPEQFAFLDRVYEFEAEIPAFDLLCGRAAVRAAVLSGAPIEEVVALMAVSEEEREFPKLAEAAGERAQAN